MPNLVNPKNPKNTCETHVIIYPGATAPVIPCLPPCVCTFNDDAPQHHTLNRQPANRTLAYTHLPPTSLRIPQKTHCPHTQPLDNQCLLLIYTPAANQPPTNIPRYIPTTTQPPLHTLHNIAPQHQHHNPL